MFVLSDTFPQFTITGISELIQVLCMILKMNISATFVVAYIQVQEYYTTIREIWYFFFLFQFWIHTLPWYFDYLCLL